jgi:outer membrane biosynthesis protein TonB
MLTRIIVSTAASLVVASIAFSQMKYSRSRSSSPTPSPTPQQKTAPVQTQSPPPQQQTTSAPRATPAPVQQKAPPPTPAPTVAKPTPTPVPPPDVKAYLDRQVASSRDKRFHLTVNGKDLALTPFHVWRQKSTGADSTSTCIDMKSDDGRIYDIDFVTTGPQVTSIKIHRINGESLR